MLNRAHRRRLLVALLAMITLLLLITFWPTPVDRPLRTTLSDAFAWLHAIGVPGWVDYRLLEFSANVILFLPLGMLVAALSSSIGIVAAGTAGLTLSLAVELGQFLLLSARTPSVLDLLANTLGAIIGAALIWAALASRRLTRPRATSLSARRPPGSGWR